ncbi:MAG: aldo/keto reductase [Candidatus Thorarchaeota archaeon]
MRFIEIGEDKEKVPVIGQGAWGIKRFRSKKFYEEWKESLRKGIELGLTHIDTAEFYGQGESEKLVGEIIKEYQRDDLFITSKLFPIHLRYKTMKKAAYMSLKRLGIKQLDLYLIHWPSQLISIKKQMKVLEDLVKEEKTRYIGVSNFSVEQFIEAQNYLKDSKLVNNQLHANLTFQNHLFRSLPYYQDNGILMTAYSPLAHRGYTDLKGKLREKLETVAKSHDATIQQIAIAWLVNQKNIITIPKAQQVKHTIANAKAVDIILTQDEVELFFKS